MTIRRVQSYSPKLYISAIVFPACWSNKNKSTLVKKNHSLQKTSVSTAQGRLSRQSQLGYLTTSVMDEEQVNAHAKSFPPGNPILASTTNIVGKQHNKKLLGSENTEVDQPLEEINLSIPCIGHMVRMFKEASKTVIPAISFDYTLQRIQPDNRLW